MKQNKSAIRIKMILTALICCMLGMTARMDVLAGDINAEEQRIIAFYNRTFTYQGKQYTATEAAKQSVYQKLAADGVDLSAAEVDSLILQASKNVAQGVQQGYLTEVTSGEESKEPQEGAKGEEEAKKEESQQDEQEKEEDKETKKEEQKEENHQEENNKKESSKETDRKKQDTDKNENRKQTDFEALKSKVEKEGENYGIVTTNEDGPITIEQYISGKITAVSEDGTVWYTSSFPIKNTGYTKGKIWMLPLIIVIGTAVTAIIGGKIHNKKILWLVMIAGFSISMAGAIGIGGKEIGKQAVNQWKSIWIVGAPKYQYEAVAESDLELDELDIKKPSLGIQYGEIQCSACGLRTPLYYGDSEEILEKGAGTYSGGALPWAKGTVLVSSHDSGYFAPLEKIEKGDKISVDTVYGSYEYEVTGKKIADVLDTSAYPLKEDGYELILYTCYPFGDTDELRNQRLFIYAEKTKEIKNGK